MVNRNDAWGAMTGVFLPLVRPGGLLRRGVLWTVAALVLLGGIFPSLYAGQVPHDHLFLGGLPPAGWEHHAHPNPLEILLGGGPASGGADLAGDRLGAARVVSIYEGTGLIILAVVTIAAVLAAAWRPPQPALIGVVSAAPPHLAPRWRPRPPTPPPRGV